MKIFIVAILGIWAAECLKAPHMSIFYQRKYIYIRGLTSK